jgi:hypothetical protein
MALELIPLCTVDVVLAEPLFVGEGPAGLRLVYEVTSAVVTGDRFSAVMAGKAGADWITAVGTVGTLDVRMTVQTEDGALVLAQYRGRTDLAGGPGAAPIYVAPTFETGHPDYAWLNTIQAVGKGELDGSALRYEWFEVR